jgi:enoyl-CoA hydratase/carnithine racemase
VPEGAQPADAAHHGASAPFATLVMGRTMHADEAREAGFVNEVVAPAIPSGGAQGGARYLRAAG